MDSRSCTGFVFDLSALPPFVTSKLFCCAFLSLRELDQLSTTFVAILLIVSTRSSKSSRSCCWCLLLFSHSIVLFRIALIAGQLQFFGKWGDFPKILKSFLPSPSFDFRSQFENEGIASKIVSSFTSHRNPTRDKRPTRFQCNSLVHNFATTH